METLATASNQPSRQAALLLSDPGQDYTIASNLMRAGYAVYVCCSMQELDLLVRSGKRPLVLAEPSYALSMAEEVARHGLELRAYVPAALPRPGPAARLAPPQAPPVTWRLAPRPRRLLDPNGHGLQLTLTEWRFMNYLFAAPNRVLNREDWQHVSAEQGALRDQHNIVVLVSRLRRKAQDAGIGLPLVAVRGTGYAFTQPCTALNA